MERATYAVDTRRSCLFLSPTSTFLFCISTQFNKVTEKDERIIKLERKIARIKGSKTIKAVIQALEDKRDAADIKIEAEIEAFEVQRAEMNRKLDKRGRELRMAEDDEE